MNGSHYVRRVSEASFDPLKGKVPLLGALDIELTERCNNRCIHCYINRPDDDCGAEVREMETAFLQDLLRQASELGCLSVRFTGGEPLLRPDLTDLYLCARKLGMKVLLFTNARLVTPDFAALLSQVPPGLPVEVTVYGMHPESYDAMAGVKGAYAEFLRGINLLRDHGIPFVVKQPLLPRNRHEITEFEAWAAKMTGSEEPPGYLMNLDLRARRDDPEKNRRIAAFRLTPEEILDMLRRHPNYVSAMREFCGRFIRPPGDRLFSCGVGHAVAVDSYGMAQMCLLLRHPDTVFDLRKGTLRQALEDFFPAIMRRTVSNTIYLERCANCFLKGLCEQCPGRSWMEHGTLDTPVQYLCDVAHAQARYLGLIRENECSWKVKDWQTRIAWFAEKSERGDD